MTDRGNGDAGERSELEEALTDAYGLSLARDIDPSRRYSIVTVGSFQFAFSTYETYMHGLEQIWEAGLVGEPAPSAFGHQLPGAAPNLRAIDPDLRILRTEDVQGPPKRFERKKR